MSEGDAWQQAVLKECDSLCGISEEHPQLLKDFNTGHGVDAADSHLGHIYTSLPTVTTLNISVDALSRITLTRRAALDLGVQIGARGLEHTQSLVEASDTCGCLAVVFGALTLQGSVQEESHNRFLFP